MSGALTPAAGDAYHAAAATGGGVAGVGIDIVEIDRVRRALERTATLLDRLFTAREQQDCRNADGSWRYWKLAARFAAKEAVSKAIGTGIDGFGFTDIEIINNANGRPEVLLTGDAVRVAAAHGVGRFHLSLSHTSGVAVAQVVAERLR